MNNYKLSIHGETCDIYQYTQVREPLEEHFQVHGIMEKNKAPFEYVTTLFWFISDKNIADVTAILHSIRILKGYRWSVRKV